MASAGRIATGNPMSLFKDGYKHVEMAILKNIDACESIGKLTKSSLGPNGMNKLIVNHLGKIFVTSDTSTILTEMEIVHPAAKLMLLAANMQAAEYADYTNFVITFCSELLAKAKTLLRIGVHPSEIIIGYKKANDIVLNELKDLICKNINNIRDVKELETICKGPICSKFYGYEDLISTLVANASVIIIPPKKLIEQQSDRTDENINYATGKLTINVDNVRVAKLIGSNIHESYVVKGMVIRRPPLSQLKRVENAKVAVFATSVESSQTETKGTVLINNADELLNYNKTEEDLLNDQIKGIKDSGIDVIIAGGSVSDTALHFIDRYNMMVIKINSKFELRRLCKCVGATPLVRLGPVTKDEMGNCDLVETQEIASGQAVIFQQNKEETAISTIVLRSSTTNQLDDLERAINSGVNTVKTLTEDSNLLPGAGATEIALALKISKAAENTPGLEQYALEKFSEALEIVPKILAENAGYDTNVSLSKLYKSQKDNNSSKYGIDIETGEAVDVNEIGIYDAYAAKYSAIRLAIDTAITLLGVDSVIMSKQAGGPKLPSQQRDF